MDEETERGKRNVSGEVCKKTTTRLHMHVHESMTMAANCSNAVQRLELHESF